MKEKIDRLKEREKRSRRWEAKLKAERRVVRNETLHSRREHTASHSSLLDGEKKRSMLQELRHY